MAIAPEYDKQEAKDLLGLCAYVEAGVQPPIPDPRPGWSLLFDSPEIGDFKNKWQLWQRSSDRRFAIALRGTILQAGSILEDLISIMVKATGTLSVGPMNYPYKFAADPDAGVHLGFALGTLLLLNDSTNGILAQLAEHGVAAGSDLYITGHSQGAAMATLLRSYLEHTGGTPTNCSIKTYVFAQPKPGNPHYAADFEGRFCDSQMAFRVTNVLDWVPQVPFTLQLPDDIDKPNPLSVITSPSLLIALITKAVAEAQAYVEAHSRARLQSTVVGLVHAAAPQPALAPAPQALLAIPFAAPVMHTLNFVNAGTDIPRLGTPAVGTQCQDSLFEHHVTTYFPLI
jgi:Lipase (class 3)